MFNSLNNIYLNSSTCISQDDDEIIVDDAENLDVLPQGDNSEIVVTTNKVFVAELNAQAEAVVEQTLGKSAGVHCTFTQLFNIRSDVNH